MHFVFNFLFLVAGIKWGKWREWQKYYPTILFFILCDIFANYMMYNYPLWRYQESILGMEILNNHTIISIMIMFFVYPATTLIYLGRFPKENWKGFLWTLFWIFLYWAIEFINFRSFKLVTHNHGWTMTWSFAFDVVLFTTIWAHYKKPYIAWILAIAWATIIIIVFDIPIRSMP